ncbi:DNA-processing protein DprA [Pseudidiomarina mangrovi]|uniref:DNA-processing protein DprA n=1 Tax=Pseudidiomarina mangrovi TaxID=2487133 RepID=UPI000FCC7B74|nr:DNA-processing protein DprA [Pseudidiomarina mangrovi]
MDADTLTALLQLQRSPARNRHHAMRCSSLAQAQQQLPAVDIDQRELNRCLAWLEQPQQHLVHWYHPDYPEALRHIAAPPPMLFVRGDRSLLTQPQVALVGSRNASPVGQHSAAHFAATLASAGIVVSSGLATGIDAAAHRSALQHGRTLAVLGTGADCYYPPRNRQLQQQIAQAGALVTEFTPGTRARADHFPRRNRILSGLSEGVLVIEAKRQSGTLNTARLALEQNKRLWALPGSIWDVGMAGCLQLLQQGAQLVTQVGDIIADLGLRITPPDVTETSQNKSAECLANPALLANVGTEVTALDTIVARSGLPVAIVTEQLVLLELAGVVTSVAGGYIKMGRR